MAPTAVCWKADRDYVRVTLAMTVASADVAGAVAEAWQAFMDTARANPEAGTWPARPQRFRFPRADPTADRPVERAAYVQQRTDIGSRDMPPRVLNGHEATTPPQPVDADETVFSQLNRVSR